MKLNRKLEIVEAALLSITSHEEEDGAVRMAALDQVSSMVAAHREQITAEIQSKISAALRPAAA